MPEPYEIWASLDEGFTIPGGRPWSGIRVQYRPLGSRGRWSRFLLEANKTPSIAQLQEVCAVHERETHRPKAATRGAQTASRGSA